MTVFVDSSAWFAATNSKDAHHRRATYLLGAQTDLIATNLVVTETWLLTNSRLGFRTAQKFWAGLRLGIAAIKQATAADLDASWSIAAEFAHQTFSLVDCTSFVIMERLGITRAISLDDDFVFYRFGPNRDRALEVLR